MTSKKCDRCGDMTDEPHSVIAVRKIEVGAYDLDTGNFAPATAALVQSWCPKCVRAAPQARWERGMLGEDAVDGAHFKFRVARLLEQMESSGYEGGYCPSCSKYRNGPEPEHHKESCELMALLAEARK